MAHAEDPIDEEPILPFQYHDIPTPPTTPAPVPETPTILHSKRERMAAEDLPTPHHKGEFSTFSTVSPRLLGSTNFEDWLESLEIAIAVSRAGEWVEKDAGEPHKAENGVTLSAKCLRENKEWRSTDAQLAGAILMTISSGLRSRYHGYLHPKGEDATEVSKHKAFSLLKALKDEFDKKGGQESFSLERKFVNFKCGDKSIREYSTELESMRHQLDRLNITRDMQVVHVFLSGLPPAYGEFVRSQLALDTLPDFNSIRNAALRIEQNFAESEGTVIPEMAASVEADSLEVYYTRLANRGVKPSAKHPCIVCDSPNHWAVDCPKKGKGATPQNNSNSNNSNWRRKPHQKGKSAT